MLSPAGYIHAATRKCAVTSTFRKPHKTNRNLDPTNFPPHPSRRHVPKEHRRTNRATLRLTADDRGHAPQNAVATIERSIHCAENGLRRKQFIGTFDNDLGFFVGEWLTNPLGDKELVAREPVISPLVV